MSTAIIVVLLLCLSGWAISRLIRRFRQGSGCCGEHEASVKRIGVTDRDKSHYPYQLEMDIGGMTCENCAIRVENALNGLGWIWANVDIADKKAYVRCKREPDEKQLRQAVTAAGYVVTDFRR